MQRLITAIHKHDSRPHTLWSVTAKNGHAVQAVIDNLVPEPGCDYQINIEISVAHGIAANLPTRDPR